MIEKKVNKFLDKYIKSNDAKFENEKLKIKN